MRIEKRLEHDRQFEEKKNLLRKCQEKHTNYVSIDAILVWLDNIKKELED